MYEHLPSYLPIFLEAETDLFIILILMCIGVGENCRHLWSKAFLTLKHCTIVFPMDALTKCKIASPFLYMK